jgi:MFS transporter, putative metabolite:H+ symporter
MEQETKNKSLEQPTSLRSVLIAPVIVGALGYFVDIYDLVLFSIVRVESLKSLGVPAEELLEVGVRLINMQMFGMLLGGILWGVLGDKRGRVSVLFGSIFLYSSANIANAFVTNVDQYAWLRFIAGIGLAGELGAAITLVSEVLPQKIRGYGTTLVGAVGLCGALLAALIGENFSWKAAYLIGGILGFSLLLLRIQTRESTLFHSAKQTAEIKRGDFFLLFRSRERFLKYIACISIGVPIWFVIGILITFAPELTRSLGVEGEVTGGRAIFFGYLGLAIGDVVAGIVSQKLQSRKKAVLTFLVLTTASVAIYFFARGVSSSVFYGVCVLLGFSVGYWALFVTIAAEQFGTNLRATVTTTVPNFVRGSVVPLTLLFRGLIPTTGPILAATITGCISLLFAWFGLWKLEESFHKNLNHFEKQS